MSSKSTSGDDRFAKLERDDDANFEQRVHSLEQLVRERGQGDSYTEEGFYVPFICMAVYHTVGRHVDRNHHA